MRLKKIPSDALGYLCALVQAACYASMGIFSRLLYTMGLDAQQVMVLRFGATVVLLGAFMLVWRRQPLLSRQPAVYAQGGLFFLGAWFYFLAVQYLGAGLATVIFYSFPAVVALMSTFFFRERLSVRIVVALFLAVIGILLISGALLPGSIVLDQMGIFFGVAACLAFAGYTVLIQKTGRVEGSFTATFSLCVISLALSLVLFSQEVPGLVGTLDIVGFLFGIVMALVNTVLPIVLFMIAIRRIGATKASILSISEIPFSLILAWLVLGETLDLCQALGSALVIAAILIVTLKARADIS